MTMTDTEAKALALALLNTVRDSRGLPAATMEDADDISWFEALCRAIEREASIEALCRVIEREASTEARHAAELREQAERFSEAVERVLTVTDRRQETHAWRTLSPFILPAPDPLVEVIADVRPWDTNHQWNNAAFSKRLAAAIEARGGKIVWEAGE